MRHGFDKGVVVGIVLLALMMAGIGASSYVNVRSLRDNSDRVAHSRKVIDSVNAVQFDTVHLQAALRVYLVTGFEEWIPPYHAAVARLRADATRLENLTADDPEHRPRSREAGREIETGVGGFNTAFTLRGGPDGHAAIVAFSRERGPRSFVDPLLETLAQMDRIERERLASSEAESRRAYDRAIFYGVAAAVLGLLAVAMFVWVLARSIRTRARDAERLADQRELLAATLVSIGDGVVATDEAGRITFMNTVAERLTGWGDEEVRGVALARVFNIVNESTRAPVENPASRALKEGVIVGLANHTVLIARDGTERPIDDSAAPISTRGVIRGAVLVFRDITERHVAARERDRLLGEVVAERRLLDAVFDALPVGAVVAEPGGRLVRMNRANADLWGGPPRTNSIAEYAPWVGYWAGTDRRIGPEEWALARILTTGESVAGDRVEIEPFDGGGRRSVVISGAPVRDAEGRLVAGVIALLEVTERERAERRLRESEERRRLALDGAELGAWHVDPSAMTLTTDERFRAIFGVPGDRLDYERAVAAIHPDDRDRVRDAVASATRPDDPLPYAVEYRVVHPDGAVRWVFAKGRANFEAEGLGRKMVSFDGTVADVTDRKQAESEREGLLRQVDAERARLAEVFRHAPSFMGVLRGPDHVFELTNDRYLELMGGRDVTGRSVREALPEVVGQGYLELLDQVYRTGEPYIGTAQRVELMRGGALDERFVDFVYQPLCDADGAVSGILVQGIDITDRKRAEAGLVRVTAESERQRRLYEAVLSATPDFVYVFSLEHRVVYANEALIAMWGRGREGAIGKTFLEVGYEPWHAELHGREIDQVRETRQPIRGEVPFNGTLGRRMYDYIFVPVFGPNGEVEAVAGTTRDVTERQRAEEALRQLAADLSEADRRKDEFLATLAHELRNPLAPVRNGVQILRTTAPSEPRLERTLGMMDRQLAHMVHLVDDLMDVSRVSRGKVALRKERVELREVVDSAVESARPVVEAGGHELAVRLPAEPLVFDADKTRLAQVLANLLNNSAKYTPRGGRITLTAERVGGAAVIRVTDTGVGIPADMLTKVFDMFTQLGTSLDRAQGGLGIGLTLVKRLVEMHGGTVAAESPGPDLGSTFTVELPAVDEHATRPAPRDVLRTWGRRILVVDDNRDGAESLAEMLRLLGNEVDVAHDGLEAVETAERFRPDVILMDLGMPKLNGLEATRRIRGHEWGKAMTIVAQTGWGQQTDRDRSREAGCDGHLVKPVNLSDLEKLLEQLLGTKRD